MSVYQAWQDKQTLQVSFHVSLRHVRFSPNLENTTAIDGYRTLDDFAVHVSFRVVKNKVNDHGYSNLPFLM